MVVWCNYSPFWYVVPRKIRQPCIEAFEEIVTNLKDPWGMLFCDFNHFGKKMTILFKISFVCTFFGA
jgi:hypothetical protein